MKTTNVAIINGISLQVVADEREQLVAVKPVCEILGVAYPPQLTKLREHPIFGPTITLDVTVGADGKAREMAGIPLRFFPSWLFSINPNNEKAERLRIAKSELKVAENELNKALALTFEDWQANDRQLTIPGFE